MALYINKELNSLVFTKKDFKMNRNYLPDFLMALKELNSLKNIKIAIDLDETPILFVLYFRKLLQESSANINIYYKDSSASLKKVLKDYGMAYNNIKKYPNPMPDEEFFPTREEENKTREIISKEEEDKILKAIAITEQNKE
jgi:hypothetical protein